MVPISDAACSSNAVTVVASPGGMAWECVLYCAVNECKTGISNYGDDLETFAVLLEAIPCNRSRENQLCLTLAKVPVPWPATES